MCVSVCVFGVVVFFLFIYFVCVGMCVGVVNVVRDAVVVCVVFIVCVCAVVVSCVGVRCNVL